MTLAIHGGRPVREKPFPRHRTIGYEEKEAVARVLDSGVLSKYLGVWHEDFFGGPEVRALEEEWAKFFGVGHAVAVNSCTSGLFCAVGAIGTEPGEEIIVTPYTMSATAVAPSSTTPSRSLPISNRTFSARSQGGGEADHAAYPSILVVDLFGQP
jgi:hypothetical protein